MENVPVMQSFQSGGHLDESLPDFPLRKLSCVLLMRDYLFIQVAHPRELHHYAQGA